VIQDRKADTQLSPNVGQHKTCFNPFNRIHALAVGNFRLPHEKPLPLKILPLGPLALGDEYR
jgi:hypothetical protein